MTRIKRCIFILFLADYFNVSLDYLCDRDNRYPTPSADEIELLNIYDALDKQGRTIVLASAYQQKQRQEAENA